jgi:hypothetical protein
VKVYCLLAYPFGLGQCFPLGSFDRSACPNFLIVNYGPQYYYCSFQIQPDDIDTCGLYCLYYFKRRHRGMELLVKDFSKHRTRLRDHLCALC